MVSEILGDPKPVPAKDVRTLYRRGLRSDLSEGERQGLIQTDGLGEWGYEAQNRENMFSKNIEGWGQFPRFLWIGQWRGGNVCRLEWGYFYNVLGYFVVIHSKQGRSTTDFTGGT